AGAASRVRAGGWRGVGAAGEDADLGVAFEQFGDNLRADCSGTAADYDFYFLIHMFFSFCFVSCSYRTFATNLISISCVGSANRGVTTIVLATSGLCDPYASFRTGPAAAKAVSMSVT